MAPNPQLQSPRPAETNDPNYTKPTHHTSAWVGLAVAIIVILVVAYIALYFLRIYRARRHALPPPSINLFRRQERTPTRNYPASGGIVGWIEGKVKGFRGGGGAGGGGGRGKYRSAGGGARGVDDEAWDSRMGGDEEYHAGAYAARGGGGGAGYEEQELGLRGAHGGPRGSEEEDLPPSYGGAVGGDGYGPVGARHGEGEGLVAGREGYDDHSERELGAGYDKNPFGEGAQHVGAYARDDPFGDHAAAERSEVGGRSASPAPPGRLDTGYHGASKSTQDSKDDSPTERRSVFREAV